MADIKSLQTLKAELRTFTRAFNRTMDVSDNSLINDLLFEPYAVGGNLIMSQVEIVRQLRIISSLEGTDLDEEATNYNLERSTGSYATGMMTLFTVTLPTGNVTVDAATQFSTSGTAFDSPVTFTVDNDYVFPLASADAYYNYDRARYEFPVAMTCDDLGTLGNIGANLITQVVSPVSQISGGNNLTATSGGLGTEEDDTFRERIRLAMIGRCLNVAYGLQSFIRGLGFVGAFVIKVEEVGYERATGADAFVIDYSSTAATDTFTYDPAQTRYFFTYRPALAVTSVSVQTIGELDTAYYVINIDSISPLRRSPRAWDFIGFIGAPIPVGAQITVQYNYSSTIYQAQQTLDLPTNDVPTADILLKRANPLSLFLTATLTLKANADGPDTRNKVRNALSQALSEYTLGQDIQKSDMIIIIQQGYGDYPIENVDAVVISNFYLQAEDGTLYQDADSDGIIEVNNTQHAIMGSATLV